MSVNTFSSSGKKKFGLVPSQKPKKTRRPVVSSIFSSQEKEDSDDESSKTGQLGGKMMDIRRANIEISGGKEEALEVESGGIYDYDGAYDEFKEEERKKNMQKIQKHAESSSAPKSRYIGQLQAVAKVREIESDRRYERKLLKERKEEDEQFGDKQKFVTSAYRKKLLEEEKWAYEDKLAEKVEESTGASRQGMHGFYSNLFTKNISFGGDVSSATSAYTAGSERQRRRLEDPSHEDSQSSGEKRKSSSEEASEKEATSEETVEDANQSAKEVSIEGTTTSSGEEKGSDGRKDNSDGYKGIGDVSKGSGDGDGSKGSKDGGEGAEEARQKAIQSARERFLARKRRKTAEGSS